MDFTIIRSNLAYLLWGTWPDGPIGGAALTLILSVGSALVSGVLGLGLGVALAMSSQRLRIVLTAVLGFFRAIPVLMLIFWTYFLLPLAFGIDVPGVLSVMFSLSLIGGAYLSHSVYAGIRGIAKGQWEAGLSVGLTRGAVLRHVVLPQALRMMLPSFINQWVSLIKDTSLAYIVGVGELSFLAAQVNSRTMVYPAEVFLFVGMIYFTICCGLDLLARQTLRRHEGRAR
ncbi:amino acid ABC transporter permease [Uliginosibacterium gangwonense]|uniref:amino acid ABC transporter permease n=1 Tax=Uliginosibacterium gangwonense TaxID=392736 RepID=UPI0003804AD0|nr:amino acid ABC transporter permease [Uliginosibacterium gangwonense]